EIGRHFRPEEDFTLLSRTAMDTLDFTSFVMNLGSKMILDATPKRRRGPHPPFDARKLPDFASSEPQVVRQYFFAECCLILQLEGMTPGRPLLERLIAHPALAELPMLVMVSGDVRLDDPCHRIWGILTRFDAARDVVFPDVKLAGACPVYRGTLGIDATWKEGYPAPVQCDDATDARVSARWSEYGLDLWSER